MLLLLIFMSLTLSQGYKITLNEPMIVKTQDGSKYLYHPKSDDIPVDEPGVRDNEDAESDDDDDDISVECKWGKWGEFSSCVQVAMDFSMQGKFHFYVVTLTK